MNRKLAGIMLASVGVVFLSACGSATTEPDQVGVRYEGSVFFPQDPSFKSCQVPGVQEFGDPGDNVYPYPVGQRTFKFSNDVGSEVPPLTASSPSPGGGQPIEMGVSGTVTFTPNFANCDVLRSFHETIGIKYQAWTADGWNKMLSVYIKDVVDRAIDNEALKFDWVQLTSNAQAKADWETEVATQLPALIARQAGGDFFIVNSVLLQRPDLPANIKSAIADTEAARQQAQTAEQFKQAASSFPGGPAAYQAFQQQQAINKAIENGSVKVIPVPQGSPVIVQPGQ